MAKILIVEDERTLNEAYELILKKQGHDVEVAYNGDEALQVFKKHEPELILLDLRMEKIVYRAKNNLKKRTLPGLVN
jgi:two-component system response regulator VicR